MISRVRQALLLAPLVLLPSFMLRFSFGAVHLNLLDILLLSAVFTNFPFLKIDKLSRPILLASGGILLAALLAVFTAHFASSAIGAFKSWFLLPMLYAIVLAQSKTSLETIRRCLLIALSYTLLYAIFIFPSDPLHRLHGWYSNPNFLAMFSESILIFSLPLLKESWLERLSWVICLLLSLLTISFGGYLALIVGALVYYLAKSRPNLVPWAFGVLTIVMIGITFLPPSAQPINTFGSRSGSAEGRTQIWKTAYYLLQQQPLTGVGLYQFQPQYQKALPVITDRPLEQDVPFAHNFYLSVWTNLGLLGLVSFIILFSLLTKIAYPPLLAFLAAFLAHGILDTPYFLNDLSVIFWVVIFCSLSWYLHRQQTGKEQPE